jgi:hypothetical protein
MKRRDFTAGAALAVLAPALAQAKSPLQDTPGLAEQVKSGALPPVDKRIPDAPAIVKHFAGADGAGKPGGQANILIANSRDTRLMTLYSNTRLIVYDDQFKLQADILHGGSPAADDIRILGLHGTALALFERFLLRVAGGFEDEDIVGAELLAKGFTFVGYSQNQPSVGFLGRSSGAYVRKHNPWCNWQGTGPNQLPPAVNAPFTSFPSDYNTLPTISVVVPDMDFDMHDGSVASGDAWLKTNLEAYIQWAKTHNSLFILTFDEDDVTTTNQIATFFFGPMVQQGQYSEHITHHNLLRTLEDMYGLGHAGAAAGATPIDDVWKKP